MFEEHSFALSLLYIIERGHFDPKTPELDKLTRQETLSGQHNFVVFFHLLSAYCSKRVVKENLETGKPVC